MQQINWDNLRYVLMVANKGSISAAARELDVDRSTVLRRINHFQQDLNCRIFDRSDSGYVLTPEAEKIIDAAREVENTLIHIQRQIAGHELKLEGELRVTTTDSFMFTVLAPHLASFHRKHPHIVVDVLVTNSILDLSRRDADIAIRPTVNPDDNLIGRRLCDVEFGVYACNEMIESVSGDLTIKQNWIGYADSLRASPVGSWFEKNIDADQVCLRCDSFVGVRTAAESGIGLALMPCFLGDDSVKLGKLPFKTTELTVGLWLMAHPDLIRSARVHAFYDHISDAFARVA